MNVQKDTKAAVKVRYVFAHFQQEILNVVVKVNLTAVPCTHCQMVRSDKVQAVRNILLSQRELLKWQYF